MRRRALRDWRRAADDRALPLQHVPARERGPAVAWAMFKAEQVAFTKDKPAEFASSPEARRGFCAVCGTPLCFTASYIPGLIDITIGSLDRPEALAPALHYWDSKRLPWMKFADDLPKYPEFPPVA